MPIAFMMTHQAARDVADYFDQENQRVYDGQSPVFTRISKALRFADEPYEEGKVVVYGMKRTDVPVLELNIDLNPDASWVPALQEGLTEVSNM